MLSKIIHSRIVLASLLALMLIVMFALYAFLTVYAWQYQNAERAADAYVAECQARLPLVITINSQPFDLNACG